MHFFPKSESINPLPVISVETDGAFIFTERDLEHFFLQPLSMSQTRGGLNIFQGEKRTGKKVTQYLTSIWKII